MLTYHTQIPGFHLQHGIGQAWQHTLIIILALGRWRLKDQKFKIILDYIV